MEINTLIAILAALLLMLLGLYVFKSKDSSSSENKKPRRRADIPNRDEDGQIIQGNLFKMVGCSLIYKLIGIYIIFRSSYRHGLIK